MLTLIDVQEQFWDYFKDFKKEFDFKTDLVVIGNKLRSVYNRSQLSKIKPADNFPNSNYAIPIKDCLLHKLNTASNKKYNIILITGNEPSPISNIDFNVLKQQLVKSEVKVHTNFLFSNQYNKEEVKEFLKDFSIFTGGNYYNMENFKTIWDTIK